MPEAAAKATTMLAPILELDRLPAFSPEPHAIATDGRQLWVSSKTTRRIDVIDRDAFEKVGEIDPPGMPWGMAYCDGVLAMTCGETSDDTRIIRRYTREGGFAPNGTPCPEDTGSHLACYEGQLLLAQWYNKRLLLLDDAGEVVRRYDAPHGIAGVGVVNAMACVLGTDDEGAGDYWITRIDLADPSSRPQDVALVPFRARGLAWDGNTWWTNHREAGQIVAFVLPS